MISESASPWSGALGTPEEEATRGRASYLQVLERFHRELSPASYLEIGVRHGSSSRARALPGGRHRPAPAIDSELPSATKILALTSDDFFAKHGEEVTPDFSFIDGMHLFEYALRDFMNLERRAAPGGIIVLDDVLPNHPAQAQRIRHTAAWTGDVWRVADIPQRYRSDLFVLTIDAAPAGLLLVAGLDCENRALWDGYERIVAEAGGFVAPPPGVMERRNAVDPTGPDFPRVIEALRASRRDRCRPHEVVARLRTAHRHTEGGAQSAAIRQPKLSIVVVGYNMPANCPERFVRCRLPCNEGSTQGTTKLSWSTTAQPKFLTRLSCVAHCPV